MLIAGVLMMKAMQMKAQLSKISYEDASGVAEQVNHLIYRHFHQSEL